MGSAYDTVNNYVFAAIPTFVLMGFLVAAAGMGRDAYDIGQMLLRRVKGGLGMATVVANAIFAAITGVSVASASVFSKLSVPEMLRHGYTVRFAVGTVAGSSVLGMLIPPSVLFIIYAHHRRAVGRRHVHRRHRARPAAHGDLLHPDLDHGRWFPASVMADPRAFAKDACRRRRGAHDAQRELCVKASARSSLLIVLVLGGLYGGVFTPVEAGAAGAFIGLVFALIRRTLTWRGLWDVLLETGSVSATLLFLIMAASMYSRMLGMSGLPNELARCSASIGRSASTAC